jgi:hypothetical protein
MLDRYGQPDGNRVEIAAPLSRSELGGWTGLSREAVVKALAARPVSFNELDYR